MENEIKTKKCSKCGDDKPLIDFFKNNQNKTCGLRPKCKICSNKYSGEKFKVKSPKPGSHKYNLIGVKFGMLMVKEYGVVNKHKNKIWSCECDCGNFCEVTTTDLNKGRVTSCKCNQYKSGDKTYNYTGYKEISGAKWYSIKSNANIRGLEFSITKEIVWELLKKQNDKCYFSGLPISFKNKTASIDRLDSSIGYNIDNIALVHKDVNRMKSDFPIEYFKKLCEYIANKE